MLDSEVTMDSLLLGSYFHYQSALSNQIKCDFSADTPLRNHLSGEDMEMPCMR